MTVQTLQRAKEIETEIKELSAKFKEVGVASDWLHSNPEAEILVVFAFGKDDENPITITDFLPLPKQDFINHCQDKIAKKLLALEDELEAL